MNLINEKDELSRINKFFYHELLPIAKKMLAEKKTF
jgi:hypothetical protein